MSRLLEAIECIEKCKHVDDLLYARKLLMLEGLMNNNLEMAIKSIGQENHNAAKMFLIGPTPLGSTLGAIEELKIVARKKGLIL
jgi:hypothetical protein